MREEGRRRKRRAARWTAVLLVALLWVGLAVPVHAGSKARVFGASLFVAGLGLKAGSAVVGGQARETYDDYLLTGLQDRIDTLRADYTAQKRRSDQLTNLADGFMVVGALLTVYSVLRSEGRADVARASEARLMLTPNARRREWLLSWEGTF